MPSSVIMVLRQRGREPGVAFVFRDGNHAGLRDGKVRAGDPHIGGDVLLPQGTARDHGELLGIIRWRAPQLPFKQLGNIAPREVHGGENDVVGRLVPELHDVLAEVALHDFKAAFSSASFRWISSAVMAFDLMIERAFFSRTMLRMISRACSAVLAQWTRVPRASSFFTSSIR